MSSCVWSCKDSIALLNQLTCYGAVEIIVEANDYCLLIYNLLIII